MRKEGGHELLDPYCTRHGTVVSFFEVSPPSLLLEGTLHETVDLLRRRGHLLVFHLLQVPRPQLLFEVAILQGPFQDL